MRALLLILALAIASLTSRAERYLTVEQAQKLAFPKASRIEVQTLRFTGEQIQAIEEKSGVPVKAEGNKVVYAYDDSHLLGVLSLANMKSLTTRSPSPRREKSSASKFWSTARATGTKSETQNGVNSLSAKNHPPHCA
jgi:hypothetical protein